MLKATSKNTPLKLTLFKQTWFITFPTNSLSKRLPLTPKTIKRLIPNQSHLEVKLTNLTQFGSLLTTWEIKIPLKQVTRILFQEGKLLRFSLKGPWGTHHFFPDFKQQTPADLNRSEITQWLRQFTPNPPLEAISLPQTGFKVLGKLPSPPKLGALPLFQGLSPLSEALKTKPLQVWGYDVNSLYPFCMLLPFPAGFPQISKKRPLENLFGLAEAIISPPFSLIPATPQLKGALSSFSLTPFKGIYFSEELKYLQELGYSITLKRSWHFSTQVTLPQPHLHRLYQHKQTIGDPSIKIWLNSLYGRLAFSKIKPITLLEKKEGRLNPNRALIPHSPWTLTRSIKPLSSKNPYTLWGGLIISYGRMFLHSLSSQSPNTLCYLDTDALFSSQPWTPQKLGTSLGQFKMVTKNRPLPGLFVAPKIYALPKNANSSIKIRGIPNPNLGDLVNLIQQLSPDNKSPKIPFSLTPRREWLTQDVSFPFSHP